MAEISTLNGYKIKDKKAIRYYNTVADMLADTTLKNGMHCKTKGYHLINDGGHGEYLIINDSNLTGDGGSIHALNNGLYAKLIIFDRVNVMQFGAKGDGESDDTLSIQNAINLCMSKGLNLYLPTGTFNHTGLSITSPIEIIGTGQTILNNISDNDSITINQIGGTTNYIRTKLKNLILENNNNIGVNIVSGNIDITDNVRIRNSSTGIENHGGLYVDNIRIDTADIGMNLATSDNHINNVTTKNCMLHYKNSGGFNIFKNVHGWNFDSPTKDWTSESVFMEINTTQTEIINCYADTLAKIFDIKNTSQYLLLNIQNLMFFINSSSYGNNKPKPIFFTQTNGKVNVNSFECDFNGYTGDGTGNIVDYPANIRIDNFIGNGVKFNENIYYHDEINATITVDPNDTNADLLYNENSFLSANTKKLVRKNRSRYLNFDFSLKKTLSSNSEIWNVTCRNRFSNLNGMQFTCYAYTSSNIYPLDAYIENDTLHIWNKGDSIPSATGVILKGILESVY